jgi:hypothetical protein
MVLCGCESGLSLPHSIDPLGYDIGFEHLKINFLDNRFQIRVYIPVDYSNNSQQPYLYLFNVSSLVLFPTSGLVSQS